jgi:hypothetical protein
VVKAGAALAERVGGLRAAVSVEGHGHTAGVTQDDPLEVVGLVGGQPGEAEHLGAAKPFRAASNDGAFPPMRFT